MGYFDVVGLKSLRVTRRAVPAVGTPADASKWSRHWAQSPSLQCKNSHGRRSKSLILPTQTRDTISSVQGRL